MFNIENENSHVGILSAMPEEIGVILDNLTSVSSSKFGDLEIFTGEWLGKNSKRIFVSVAWSGWGKVSAARATTRLLSNQLNNLPLEILLFTGVAGAVDKKLKQWDIIISDAVIQHDMDARPIFDKFVIPAIKEQKIIPDQILIDRIYNSLKAELNNQKSKNFGNLYKGLIGTGDMFISDRKKIDELKNEIKDLLAVEMEGAAFAQVAKQENINWIVMRVISDGAEEGAQEEFEDFLKNYTFKSFDLIKCFLDSL